MYFGFCFVSSSLEGILLEKFLLLCFLLPSLGTPWPPWMSERGVLKGIPVEGGPFRLPCFEQMGSALWSALDKLVGGLPFVRCEGSRDKITSWNLANGFRLPQRICRDKKQNTVK
ncbi:hypothetical protein AVEN_252342-1 [Araneus ventricosus]|uniref:Uncharacterized protein n=1 Tax=Araneus ventricosus TaxID=182803 RepID=A0A4Y2ASJ5_ARAVE|nr:hypothetical protein AVEN_252342-1 [Araneus ventricosus]